jgi:hypothetical protein
MATNRDLLKEAIADAKTVKATAIANAKAALEEAFTPHLTQMLSAKLQEMENVDEEEENVYEEANDSTNEVSLEELLAELKSDDDLKEAKGEEEENEESEEMSIEDMGEDDLKSFIEDVIKDMVAAGELEAGHEGMENEEGAEEHEAGESEEEEYEEQPEEMDEDINLEELLNENESSDLKVEWTPEYHKAIKEYGDEAYDEKGLATGFTMKNGKKVKEIVGYYVPEGGNSSDEDFDVIGHIYSTSGKDIESYSEDELDNAFMSNLNENESNEMSLEELLAELSKVDEEYHDDKTEELEEAMATIAILKKDLNEINLLNAKLLYTNKIFRSKSLTESQKVKVLTAFDKATSKKEVELVYETLNEGLKVSTISTKSPIKESLGSASRALGSAVAKPIIENDAFARMRELAGLKK